MTLHSDKISFLIKEQNDYEKRFNCIVCMEPKLQMVYGTCQHRLCTDCLYLKSGKIRTKMDKCPICLTIFSFPSYRPDIPEDNIEMQRCVGVRACPNASQGCTSQMWEWELEEHKMCCPFEKMETLGTPRKRAAKTIIQKADAKSMRGQTSCKGQGASRNRICVKQQNRKRSARM